VLKVAQKYAFSTSKIGLRIIGSKRIDIATIIILLTLFAQLKKGITTGFLKERHKSQKQPNSKKNEKIHYPDIY